MSGGEVDQMKLMKSHSPVLTELACSGYRIGKELWNSLYMYYYALHTYIMSNLYILNLHFTFNSNFIHISVHIMLGHDQKQLCYYYI